jgi:hypothetical protein
MKIGAIARTLALGGILAFGALSVSGGHVHAKNKMPGAGRPTVGPIVLDCYWPDGLGGRTIEGNFVASGGVLSYTSADGKVHGVQCQDGSWAQLD